MNPEGRVLPCHAAETIPWLAFETVRDRPLAAIWADGPAFEAFRGTDWMQEPCRSCERREIDWGGCRCQAMAIAGDAAATDPACIKSPLHARMTAVATSGRPAGDVAPGAEGFVILRALKESQATKDIPVIAMTGSPDLNTTARARVLALGAADFIAKPFDLNMLVTEIGLFLATE